MNNKNNALSMIIIGTNKTTIPVPKEVNVFYYNEKEDLYDLVNKITSKYVVFLNEEDAITKNYFDIILKKVNEDFDCCYINNCFLEANNKIHTNADEFNLMVPAAYEYIWDYIFPKNHLLKLLECTTEEAFKTTAENLFKNRTSITEVIYMHNTEGKIHQFGLLCNRKEKIHLDNIIYVGDFCNGHFNGYITWIIQLGKAFGNKYDIGVLYNDMPDKTYERLNMYLKCVRYSNRYLYVCKSLLCTYSTYFYPHNIIYLEESSMFIHGMMSDYPHSRIFTDDYYDRYIAVSESASIKAQGYFPTNNIEYILNPYIYEKPRRIKHLKLVSAQRNAPEKRKDRIEKFAAILDKLNIPYTWNVFIDSENGINRNGLIYRHSISNVIDYSEDADYVVLLSDSEACGYTLVEALSAQVKVIITPLDVCKDLNIVDGENGYIIPFEYFEEGYEELLTQKILEIYENKDRPIKYEYKKEAFDGYNTVFK